MKRRLYILVALILTGIFLVGCESSNESKITELNQKILELEEANEDNQIFINSWQSKYDDAKKMYNSTMSMTNPEQRYLDYAKENMDEATKEINALKREIDLNNLMIREYKEDMRNFKN